MNRLAWTWTVALLALGATAFAAEASRVPPEIAACAGIRQNSERLACFDQAVLRLESDATGDASKPAPSAEDMFGMNASTSRPEPERKVERTQVESLTAKVKAVRHAGEDVILELDNGQTWRQISGSGAALLIKTGDEVKITRGALSSFNLTTPTGRIPKVKRVQ